MNVRIGQLAEDAELLGPNSRIGNSHDATQRFAELIIQECLTVLNKRFMGDLNREDLEVRRCIADVKKHFGVEE